MKGVNQNRLEKSAANKNKNLFEAYSVPRGKQTENPGETISRRIQITERII